MKSGSSPAPSLSKVATGFSNLLRFFLAWILLLTAGSAAFADKFFATSFAPERGSEGICADTPLYITFNQPPLVSNSGAISVHQWDGTIVDTIDLADPSSYKKYIGGAQAGGVPYPFNYHPIIVTENTAAIYLHQQLDYGQTYYVTVDPGVFVDADGDVFHGIQRPWRWRFTTKPSPPPMGTADLMVAADGSGDFCTVQGAIDFVPQNNVQPVTITVGAGVYNEIVYVRSNKPFITVRGADRDGTIIQYPNNSNFNGMVSGNFRAMFGEDAPDFTLENISLHNTTPFGGSQAEAFRGNNQRILLNRVNLSSFQDTLLLQGKGFVTNSYIEGDVDFMWSNSGTVFLQYNELKGLHAGYYTQIRNDQSHFGYVYVNNTLTRSPDLADNTMYLGRIDPNVFPYSQVVYINTAMDSHIRPVGWLLNNANCTQATNVQFWEYRSTDLQGNPIDVSQRIPCSRQLTDEQAVQWSDPGFVLSGWVPNTVNAGPGTISPEDNVTVNWSAPPGHSATDWIGLYRVGDSDTDYLDFAYAGDGTTGVLTFTAPDTPGDYEFRYFLNDTFTRAATSNTVSVQ